MAKIKTEDKEIEIKENSQLRPTLEKLDVPFGCNDGKCGSCVIEVEEGMENLTERTKAENDMGLDGNLRLGCQCRILKGEVGISLF